MAIQWGPWAGTSPKRFRLGVDFTSVPKPTSTSGYVTVKANVYVGVEYSVDDVNNTFTWSGTLGTGSGKRSVVVPTNGTKVLQALSAPVKVGYTTTNVSVSASLQGLEYYGYSTKATVSASVTVAAKTNNPPAAPTVSVSRASDTSHTLRVGASSTSAAPITRYDVQLWSMDTNAWASVGTVNYGSTTFRVATTKANGRYQLRARTVGPGGVSAWVNTPVFLTTPAPPQTVKAQRGGTSIVLQWSRYARYETAYEVWASADGGALNKLVTLAPNAWTWTHDNPDPTKVWTYHVRTHVSAANSGVGANLWSSYAVSNEVRLLAAPMAPTPLAPVGTTIDPAQLDTVRLTWRHNPVDTTDQVAYQLTVLSDGVTKTYVGTTAQYHDVPSVDLPPSGTFTWWVATKGSHASYSPESARATVYTGVSPVVGIVSPADGTAFGGNKLAVEWAPTFDTEESQVRAEAALLDAAGTVVETVHTADSAARRLTFNTTLDDDTTYSVAVVVYDTNGLHGSTTAQFHTDFLPPATPTLEATWDDAHAAVQLTPREGVAVSGTVPTEYMAVERSLDGETWTLVVTDLVGGVGTTDDLPPLAGPLYYRAVAVSALPSAAVGEPVAVPQPPARRVWLNREDGGVLSLPYNLSIPVTHDPHVTLYRFLGRRHQAAVYALDYDPVRTVQVSGTVLVAEGPTESEFATTLLGPVYYRDPTGRSFWGVVASSFTWDQRHYGHASVSFTVTEVGHD